MSTRCGLHRMQVVDGVQNVTIPVAVLYPTEAAERVESFGPYTLEVAEEAPVSGEGLPVVLISHGRGGTPWVYRDLAKHLATAGFVVMLPEHIGNSRNDNSLEGTAANLENRPRHVSLALDAVFADAYLSSHLGPPRVGIIGHSIGAYTALALAGGRPWAAAHETGDRQPRPVRVTPDRRVQALALLMPATFWFPEGSLREVSVPVLIRTGSRDEITTSSLGEAVRTGVSDPSLVTHEVISGAGHFSIMSPFPPALAGPAFPPSQDPEGFDRVAYQSTLFTDLERFFTDVLIHNRRPV
jgi:predicted dienelactone hydrolase